MKKYAKQNGCNPARGLQPIAVNDSLLTETAKCR